jgi:lysophospholipase L1-like esterase
LVVWFSVAVAVLLLANFGVVLVESHLAQPQLWPSPEMQHKYDGVTALSPGHRVSTVLFGDSLLDGGGDPALMTRVPGVTYNASLAGETLPTISSWATRVVTPRLHPRTVVLGFSVNILNANIPGAATVQAAYSGSRTVHVAEGSGDVTDVLDHWLGQHVPLYRYRSVLRQVFQPSASSAGSAIYDPPLSDLGWNQSFRVFTYGRGRNALSPTEGQAELRNDLLFDFAVGSQQRAELGALIDQLRREGAHVELVAMPVTADYAEAVPGGPPAYAAAVAQLQGIGRAHRASVATVGLWANRYFADPAHLNAAGTQRFSRWLTGQLASGTRNHS